ncbi:adenylate kinase [Candidatus Uhrbacteria bacterium CG_4_9_14_3_um_filter_36_7]|uniref:Adenylate kinase n=1 Tax=Candidatus Uhrbacteria bacterium CG_4_9_14_3_um_filter_36_7 TaxID=1975033 RepID=A0A2M7XIE3_9BACT|nr:MAG: adenylate kinase [Candidatus Uhrbacteria bacterium CG_4_9_14_3_um_filter_36_7]
MEQKIYKIFIMGPQGSGKGTQAELLSKKLGIPAFSMGQLLRDEITTGSLLGEQIASIINVGNLVPDTIAASVLKERLEKPDLKDGYILDGFPRDRSQYEAFTFDKPTHVIVIEVPKEESLRRLSGRLVCGICWKTTNKETGAQIGDLCSCGGKYIERDDDKPEAILRRLDIYQKDTLSIIDGYKKEGLVYFVDGIGGKEVIHERILALLK